MKDTQEYGPFDATCIVAGPFTAQQCSIFASGLIAVMRARLTTEQLDHFARLVWQVYKPGTGFHHIEFSRMGITDGKIVKVLLEVAGTQAGIGKFDVLVVSPDNGLGENYFDPETGTIISPPNLTFNGQIDLGQIPLQ